MSSKKNSEKRLDNKIEKAQNYYKQLVKKLKLAEKELQELFNTRYKEKS